MAAQSLALSIVIGAALAGGFRSTIGQAVAGVRQLGSSVGGLAGQLGMLGGAFGAIAGAGGVAALGTAVRNAIDFEAVLGDIAITAGIGNERLAALGEQLARIGRGANQSKEDLAAALRVLVSSGLGLEQALAALPAIATTATASGAAIEDLARSAFVLVQTLGVEPGRLSAELDRLAFAGKKGAFELRDMARELPSLGASLRNLGITGSEGIATLGAALQIVREGSGSAGEAANNLLNVFQKIASPEVLRNFRARGVDLTRLMERAIKEGENPFEAVLGKLDEMLARKKSDPQRAKLLGELFGDLQVQAALKALLPNLARYRDLKAEIESQTGGTVTRDFGQRMGLAAEKARQARNALGDLGTAVGNVFLPPIGKAAEALTPVVEGMAEFAAKEPGFTGAVLAAAGALATFGLTPIGAAVAGLVGAATLLVTHWNEVKDAFKAVGDAWETYIAGPLRRAAEAPRGIDLIRNALPSKEELVRANRQALGLDPRPGAAGGGSLLDFFRGLQFPAPLAPAPAVDPRAGGLSGRVKVDINVNGSAETRVETEGPVDVGEWWWSR
jgi:TP901 family phage tail tape measure protein